MKSVRVSPELQSRLSATAERLGVTESEVIRMALDDFCDDVSDEPSPAQRMLALIREWEREDEGKPPIDVARHGRKLYGDYLYEKYRKRQGLLSVAEEPAEYQTAPAD